MHEFFGVFYRIIDRVPMDVKLVFIYPYIIIIRNDFDILKNLIDNVYVFVVPVNLLQVFEIYYFVNLKMNTPSGALQRRR